MTENVPTVVKQGSRKFLIIFRVEEGAVMASSFLWWIYGECEMFESHWTP